MILAATNPDTGAVTAGNLLGALTLSALLVGLLIYAAWATRGGRKGFVERWLDTRLARRAARAVDNGDVNVLRAVEAAEETHRHRSVPRRLEGTRR